MSMRLEEQGRLILGQLGLLEMLGLLAQQGQLAQVAQEMLHTQSHFLLWPAAAEP
jgi:hypothetical protein